MRNMIGAFAAILLSIGSAHAVDCDSTNECRYIRPGQVAFLFDPTDPSNETLKYLSQHRTSATRVVLSHSAKDMLVIVNRTYFVKSFDFVCESKELLSMKVNVFVNSTITPDDAATYLYNFGIRGHADNAPATMYARSLDEVMQTFGQGKLHALACEAVAKVFHNGTPTVDAQKTTAYFAGFGITVNSMWMTKSKDDISLNVVKPIP